MVPCSFYARTPEETVTFSMQTLPRSRSWCPCSAAAPTISIRWRFTPTPTGCTRRKQTACGGTMKSCGAGVGDPAGTLRIGGKVKKEGSAVNKRMLLPLFYLSKVSINSYPDLVIIYKSPLASIKHKFISSSKPLSHFATSRRSWDVINRYCFQNMILFSLMSVARQIIRQ